MKNIIWKYSHNLVAHAPLQFRIINGEYINCEDKKRFSNTIKDVTKYTSLYHPGHIIVNCIV